MHFITAESTKRFAVLFHLVLSVVKVVKNYGLEMIATINGGINK